MRLAKRKPLLRPTATTVSTRSLVRPEAVAAAREVGAERTFLVHMTHRIRHAELERALPPEIRPAYDGLSVDV